VARRPADGRPRDVRGRRPEPQRLPPSAVRSAARPARAAPLVARTDLHDPRRERVTVVARGGRIRRFVRRYGWRAYAIPLLTIATIVVLADLALTAPGTPAGTGGPTAAAPVPTVAATGSAATTSAAQGDAEPSNQPTATAAVGPGSYVQQGAGTLSVVDGSSPVYGTGPLERFIVEVEDGIEVDGATFASAVETTLGDPRSWGNGGRLSFQRVGVAEAAAGQFDFRVSLVSPGNMETYCPGVGTGGYTSCRYGDRAVINLARWATAVPDYQGDIATYRLYVVNHEVGHALGNGHQPCPGPGQVAPVMQQQTLGLDGCLKNAWPYP
jgi:hypothetical protein